MAASTSNPQPVVFPVEITKTIVFIAKDQTDLEYMTNKQQDEDINCDILAWADEYELNIKSIDGDLIK